MAKLQPQERVFCTEFLLDGDEGRAALVAGYPTARWGKRLLRKSAVGKVIDDELARRQQKLAISGERILLEWARIGFANARDYFPALGQELDISRLNIDQSAAISEFTVDEQENPRTGEICRRTRIKLHDKMAALRDLARATGLMQDEVHLTIESKIKHMTAAERQALANELIERGRRYLPAYERALAAGEISEPTTEEGEVADVTMEKKRQARRRRTRDVATL
jgi:phage terminase small subunit